ncbi:hypothetical protein ACOQH0_02660 [Enterobacter sp. JS8-1]|uniref:hypothetical protein n=1 Tax=Enterobacter sp. JS8-1 TaxID=3411633 RepID=UPI003BA34A95
MKDTSNKLLIMQNKNSDIEELVIREMGNPKWLYRSAKGIAKQTKLSESDVNEVLVHSPKVRKSVIPAPDGSDLYVLKKRKSFLGDIWVAFKALNHDKNNA